MKIFNFNNYKILIGENANENNILVSESEEMDIWLHIDNGPSCHVIIKNSLEINKHKLIKNKKLIKRCACLCKSHSKYNKEQNVKIIYTFCKNVSLTENIGEVIVENKKEIII